MKKLSLILFLTLILTGSFLAQNTFSIFYENPYYTLGGSRGKSVHIVQDTIVVVGIIVDTNLNTVGHLMKYDLNGNRIDSVKVLPSSDELWLNFGRYGGNILRNNQLIMPYLEFNNANPELEGDSLVKMDLLGNKSMITNISIDSTRRHLYRKAIEHQSGYTVLGTVLDSIQFTGYAGQKGIATHTDSLGNVLWYNTYDNVSEMFFAESTVDDGMILGSLHYVNQLGDTFDASIIRTDNLGNEMWRHHFGDEGGEGNKTPVIQLMDESYLVFSLDRDLDGFGFARGPFWVKRLIDDPSSEEGYAIIQDKKWNWSDFSRTINGVKQLEDSSIVIIGSNGRINAQLDIYQHQRGYIMKMDNNLDSLWSHFYGYSEENTNAYHEFTDFEIMPDGGYILTGWVDYPPNHPVWHGAEQMWLVRLDEFGCLEPGCQYVGIEEINIGLENTMLVYPNPVVSGNEINIRFSPQGVAEMPYVKDETQLAVYDALGREVYRQVLPAMGRNDAFDMLLSIPELAKGSYSVQWFSDKWFDAVQLVVE